MRCLTVLFLVGAAVLPSVVKADGLIYKLPADGTKVTFEMSAVRQKVGGSERKFGGTLSVASVGKEKADGVDCRWIEITMVMDAGGRKRTIVSKLLITETELGAGKIPLGNIHRGWLKMGSGDAGNFNDVSSKKGGPLPAFLPQPLKDVKKHKATEIETGIGKLQCTGLTGKTSYEQGDANRTDRFDIEYDLRRSDKVPFGVAQVKIVMKEFVKKERLDDTITMELKLKSVEKNAKSELPDNK